ncbi:alanyl-tRNA editing protein Aarsd1-B-like [Littorina saxatilis]|uniref:Alanyl-transfer RNA synthetases family profile domain-containing protein n=1 Tax=Littorina saxatilis TaxID=31220 RepID=A0AAN9AUP5_9CAEN
MALACQQNSYLRELTSKVVSCKPVQITVSQNGKKTKVQCHEVVLEDTVLFPEGGGQPDDRGQIGESEVLKVERRGATAVHYTLGELTPGSEVNMKVDWERRFDHMQQHSGQHLITAVADSLYSFKTTSWSLGGDLISTIELDTAAVSQEQVDEIERTVNEKIRQQITVTPRLFPDKTDPQLQQFRARGLPDDHEGPVRVLDIEGIDATLCCGTHVSNLAHLQAIKILGCDKGKKSKSNLMFVAGGRVLKYLGRSYQVERELTGILKGPLDKHVELSDKAIKGFKSYQKNCQTLLKDVAMLEAEVYKAKAEKDPVFCHFRKDADADYMNILVTQIVAVNPDVVCMVSVGDDKESGLMVLAGPQDIVATMGPKLAEILEAKGATTGGRFRGKVNKMSQGAKAEKMLLEYVASLKGAGEAQAES